MHVLTLNIYVLYHLEHNIEREVLPKKVLSSPEKESHHYISASTKEVCILASVWNVLLHVHLLPLYITWIQSIYVLWFMDLNTNIPNWCGITNIIIVLFCQYK